MIFAVDSIQETKLGIGRSFSSKKPIGMREMIISKHMAEHLKILVGEAITLQYDLKLILNMAQRLSGKILPSFLTKELTNQELQDPERRSELALELAQFTADVASIELQDDGKIHFDFRDLLESTAASEEATYEFVATLIENTQVLNNLNIDQDLLARLTTDQDLADFLLRNNLTNFSIDLLSVIEEAMYVYS